MGPGDNATASPGPTDRGQTVQPESEATQTIPRHYLRPGRLRRSITRLITLDTETRRVDYPGYSIHHPRVWVARLDVRRPERAPISTAEYAYGTANDALADLVEGWTRSSSTTWLYAHNLSFDASVTDLPSELVRRGWRITASHITESPIWFRLSKGRHRLVLADSHSVWPCALATLAQDMGLAKEPLPHNDDDDMAGWWARCETDVTLLATALLRALNWWDEHQLGRWSVTGSGSGWSVFKTNFLTERILIDIDDSAMRFEQQSVYGGRREAYRIGEWNDGRFVDMDFRAAYPSIVAEYDIPVRRLRQFEHMDSDAHRDRRRTRGVIAECVVRTTVPCVPVRYGESIFYPTGHFRTVLASPEIDLIHQNGGHVTIGGGYEYQLGPGMALWGQWIRSLITDQDSDLDPVVRRMAKHWSRAVIGRWTMRLSSRTPLDGFPLTGQDVTRAEWLDYDDRDTVAVDGRRVLLPGAVASRRVKGYQISFGGEYYALRADRWPENGFPAIWAWVESWCRRLLWEAMQGQAPGHVWQCDTDGFLLGLAGRTVRRHHLCARGPSAAVRPAVAPAVTPADAQTLAGGPDGGLGYPARTTSQPTPHGLAAELVVKGEYSSARILGPQHVVLGGQRRFPGVPRTAVEVAPDTFHAETWPGFLTQLETAAPGTFRQGSRTLKVGSGLNPRWTLANGRTLPVVMRLLAGLRNSIDQPPRWHGGHPVVLADDQHAVLSRVRHS